MTPQRAVGGGSVSVEDQSDYNNPYYYDPNALYSPSEIDALCADLACSALLLAAALIAIPIVVRKPWLNHLVKRNKSRTGVFLITLILLIIIHSMNIAIDAIFLQGSNLPEDYKYYSTLRLRILRLIIGLLRLGFNTLIFGLVLVEITRRERNVHHKRTKFEVLAFVAIAVLFCLQIALWAISLIPDAFISTSDYSETDYNRLVFSLEISYRGWAFMVALAMLFRAPSRKTTKGASKLIKAQYDSVRYAAWVLWLEASLSLTSLFIALFLASLRRMTITLSIGCTKNLLWIVIVWQLTLLARNSHHTYKEAGPIDLGNGGAQLLNPASDGTTPYHESSVVYGDSTPVENHGQYDPSWEKHPEVTTYNNATSYNIK